MGITTDAAQNVHARCRITNGQVELTLQYHPTPRYQLKNTWTSQTFPVLSSWGWCLQICISFSRTIPTWNALPPKLCRHIHWIRSNNIYIIPICFNRNIHQSCTYVNTYSAPSSTPASCTVDCHCWLPLLIAMTTTVAQNPLEDVTTYLSRSRSHNVLAC